MSLFNQPTHGNASLTIPLVETSKVEASKESTNHDDFSDPEMHRPLIATLPPLARLDTEIDTDDDRGLATTPYPGVDDGFFDNHPREGNNPDVEFLPGDPEDRPTIGPRAGEPGGAAPDDFDGKGDPANVPGPGNQWPVFNNFPEKPGSFPYAPGFGPDVEGGVAGSLPDINVYQNKKTLAQGMMDLALLSANANQLRYVLESYGRHPYYFPSIIMVGISLALQISVGVGLIWNARYNVKDEREICIANKINNFTVIGIFLITVINVFISAFGVADPFVPPTTNTSP